jgi:uncharacterized membrane protein
MKEPAGLQIKAVNPRSFPGDLAIILIWTFATLALLHFSSAGTSPVRTALVFPVVLFIPGYALVSALFPGSHGIDAIERVALSIGLSLAIVPFLCLGLNYAPSGIRLEPLVLCLTVIVVALAITAWLRRCQLDADDQFTIQWSEMVKRFFSWIFIPGSTVYDQVVSALLIIAVLVTAVTAVYVVVVPKEGETFTEFYILGPDHLAFGYPKEFVPGRGQSITIGIGNHEFTGVTYFVEIFAVNQSAGSVNGPGIIDRMERIGGYERFLAHNTTQEDTVTFIIRDAGFNQVRVLLFRTSPPPDTEGGPDRIDASYRDLRLWIKPLESGK